MLLNQFPQLLTFNLLAPLILRVALGFIVINLGYLKITKEKEGWKKLLQLLHLEPAKTFVKILAFIEIIGGIMLLIGSYTQVAAMVFSIMYFCEAIIEFKDETLEERSLPFYFLIFVISISLIFTGAGLLGLDAPML